MNLLAAQRTELAMELRSRLPEQLPPRATMSVVAVLAAPLLAAAFWSLPLLTADVSRPDVLTPGSGPAAGAPLPNSDWFPTSIPAVYPCDEPVRVVLDPDGGGPAVEDDLRIVVDALAQASGRHIVYAGSDRGASDVPEPAQTIVITTVPDSSAFEGAGHDDALAVGGIVRRDGVVHHGFVMLAADTLPPPGDVPGGLRPLLAHELMHALGVDTHSSSPHDLMYPALRSQQRLVFGDGDLRALAAVGCS